MRDTFSFIIQSLEEGELIALDSDIEEPYSGESIEDIAENIMEVSTAKYSEKKEAMYHAAEEYFQALNGGSGKRMHYTGND